MNELLKQLGSTLQQLQGFISENAPMVWQFYVRQVWIDAVISLIVGSILGIVAYVVFRWICRKWDDWDDEVILPILLFTALCLASTLVFIDGLRWILNPRYFALRDLLEIIDGIHCPK